MSGPLAGLRILDLSRVLAGPVATQFLGDLGADVIKIERPGEGDDTRMWGPPFIAAADSEQAPISAYFLAANRNKRSVSINLADPRGQHLVRRLAVTSDVLIENFKVGDLARRGLGYESIHPLAPGLVYCSITGFGQTGPYAAKSGYDFMVQGLGGIMSLTGEPEGAPMKVGVAVADVVCGLYAASAILAALRHRDHCGEGQHIDLSLLDTQVAWLVNQGQNYLATGKAPPRFGNAHPNIVPYQVFATADGHIILAVGNDGQFKRFAGLAGAPELAEDERFATNQARVRNRETLVPMLARLLAVRCSREWLDSLDKAGIPCGAVNTLDQVFADPQIRHRQMEITMPHEGTRDGQVRLIGNPVHYSATPVAYDRPPPALGEHAFEVLHERLAMNDRELKRLRQAHVI